MRTHIHTHTPAPELVHFSPLFIFISACPRACSLDARARAVACQVVQEPQVAPMFLIFSISTEGFNLYPSANTQLILNHSLQVSSVTQWNPPPRVRLWRRVCGITVNLCFSKVAIISVCAASTITVVGSMLSVFMPIHLLA